MTTSFEFPAFYNYPPYFTIQPVEESRAKQISLWKTLVTRYCEHEKEFVLDLTDSKSRLFNNSAINRSLNTEGRQLICGALVSEGLAEWASAEKLKCYVFGKPLRQWADTILRVSREAFTSNIMTIEDLTSGEDVTGTELEGLPEAIMRRALQILQKDGRVTFFSTAKGEGVKFL